MWDTKEFRSVDDYACAVDAHLHALAAAMGEGDAYRGAVWSREAYRVGTLEIVYRGERSPVSGEMHWVHCSIRAPLDLSEDKLRTLVLGAEGGGVIVARGRFFGIRKAS